ncbi:hypothetical protein M1247_07935 [Mycobacterium sp. 21AC1]|uniref:hypothetical protein n=1 Tax=[Mycobacterium] appelbergii TaxID=2939269 RepID=UPI0029391048|nr:hypothetical protein [Mycobacterium sp. 21AC1]MDV3124838.1 hypothetical protein [Mycobacterium sp. 21AC1]
MSTMQDWLNLSQAPRTVRSLMCTPIRSVLPSRRPAPRQEPPRLRRGVERC